MRARVLVQMRSAARWIALSVAMVGLASPAFAQRAARVAALPDVRSAAALVIDDQSGQVLYAKNTGNVHPIASITKLMTAMVVIDAKLDLAEPIEVLEDDKSKVKWSRSRLRIGATVPRADLLRLALMASDNRAAMALARTYPGGSGRAIEAMNRKAAALGLRETRFDDPAGLSRGNVSTANDLVKLVQSARRYPLVREYSTLVEHAVQTRFGAISFVNTNRLVRSDGWQIDLSKTGFIAEAGRCLVMHAKVGARPTTLVLLDAAGRYTSFADAHRIREWLEPGYTAPRNAVAPREKRAAVR